MHSQQPLRFGLVGVGGYGGTHRRAIERCREEGLAEFVAAADPTLKTRDDLRSAIEEAGVPWFATHKEMLASQVPIDAVAIAAPIPFHLDMAGDCVAAGYPVYLEKPPVPLLDQLDTLISLDPDKRIVVGFQFLNANWTRQLKQWVVDGSLGEIEEIRVLACWPRADVYYERASWAGKLALGQQPVFDGPATNALSHVIHNLMFIAAPVAGGYTVPVDVQAELYRARPIDSYDLSCLRGTLASGARYHIVLAHPCKDTQNYEFYIKGSKGWARYTDGTGRCESSLGTIETNDTSPETMKRSYMNFIEYVRGQSPAHTLLEDTRGYMLATNGMLVSSGGIHTIDPSFVQRVPFESSAGVSSIYHIEGLVDLLREASESGKLFSEMNVPWAVKTSPISLTGDSAEFNAEVRSLLGLAPAPVAV